MRTVNVIGFSEAGAVAAYYGATNPGRVRSLVMACAIVKGADTSCPWGLTPDLFDDVDDLIEHWGEGRLLTYLAPTIANSAVDRRLWGTFERAVASPGAARLLVQSLGQLNVASFLDSIEVPTLVLAIDNDPLIPLRQAEEITRRIPRAELVVVEGNSHLPWVADVDTYLDAIEGFVTGEVPQRRGDRVLATVLFTDIVDSTKRLAAVGDEAWSELVARHDALMRRLLEEHGGREVKTMGDGFLAVFDGPLAAVQCARALAQAVASLDLNIRAGVHTGQVQLVGQDVAGMTVNTAARIAAQAGAGEVLVSSAVRELLAPTGGSYVARGTHDLKGIGKVELYEACDPRPTTIPDQPRRLRVADRAALRLARRAPAVARWSVRVAHGWQRDPVRA